MRGSSQSTFSPRTLLVFLLALFTPSCAHAQHTIHIPADQPTIQSAIDVAQPGDTLLVAPGTYYENLDLHGKALTLQSAEGPATTILDGRRLGPTVSFTTNETRATTLAGFTIRNGAPAAPTPGSPEPHGAGILLANASPTLSGNILTDNLCAAIDATSSAPLVQDNRITRTIASALCTAQAVAPVVFTGAATGILIPTLLRNTIEANDLTGSPIQPNAGAIALIAAPAILQANILRLNTVPGDAPAALQILANPTRLGSTPILVQQNLIYANTTHCGPGGLAVSILNPAIPTADPHLELQILNNTIADNLTDTICPNTQPSEVELTPGYLPAQILLANNIFATTSTHPTLMCSTALPASMFHHNLLNNPQAPSACPDTGSNLAADPKFADRADADYHLNLTSPAVDAGSNSAAPLPQQDLDATPRLQNATDQPTAIVDFGAYEHPAPKLPAAATTTILNTTISPSEAFQTVTLTTAVTTAQAGTTPTGTVTLTASAPGTAPITLATMPLDATGKASYTTSSLPTGPWTILATYSGAATLSPSTSAPMLQTVNPATAILAFDITPSTAPLGQTVTAMATLTAPLSTHIPTGVIQFYDLAPTKPVLLGPATIDAKGHATLTLPAISPGTHRIMAVYPGATDFTPVNLPASDALNLTIGSSDFTAALAAPSMTLVAEHHGPVTLTLTSLGTFADTLTLSCANLPANTTCTFAPTTATLTAGSSASVTLTLDTSVIPGFARLTAPTTPQRTSTSLITLATTFPLGLVALIGLRRRSRITLAAALLLLTGCGAGKYPDHTAPGTYQINIVATAKTTGVTHTTPLTLTVTD